MQTVRGFYKDLARTKQGKTDWGFVVALIGCSIVIVLCVILLVKIIHQFYYW